MTDKRTQLGHRSELEKWEGFLILAQTEELLVGKIKLEVETKVSMCMACGLSVLLYGSECLGHICCAIYDIKQRSTARPKGNPRNKMVPSTKK